MDFSPDTLRTRFAELTAQRETIDAELVPARAELDALVSGDTKLSAKAALTRESELRERIKALQATLFPVEMERGAVARALNGKTS